MHRSISRALRIPKHPLLPSRTFTPLTSQAITKSRHPRAITGITPVLRYALHTSAARHQGPAPSPASPSPTSPATRPPNPHTNFYKTHGRALFKALTLAFFTYQVCYYAWLVLETEEIKDQKSREIQSLEGQVRLLDEARK